MTDTIANVTRAAVDLGVGFWGPATATLDWCETNYQFNHYIAEVANTFSNLATVWLAVHGARKALENQFPARLWLGQIGFALVGLGSFAFHATLLYEAQLADELPMIYVAATSAYVLFDTEPGWDMSNQRSLTLLAILLGFDTAFTATYYQYRNPVYHQVIFAVLVLMTGFRVTHLVRWSPHYTRKIPAAVRQYILRMFWTGGGLFAFGFLIWNIDNLLCDTLTRWKVAAGWPVAFLLEGHSWWHILTAIGTYLMMQGVMYLSLCAKDDPANYTIVYDNGLPHVARVNASSADFTAKK